MPISVTNSIPESDSRPSCDALDNQPMLSPEQLRESADDMPIMFAPGDATVLQTIDDLRGLGGAAALTAGGWRSMLQLGMAVLVGAWLAM
jgi:hypothetical protein